jgi:hypothetical protein
MRQKLMRSSVRGIDNCFDIVIERRSHAGQWRQLVSNVEAWLPVRLNVACRWQLCMAKQGGKIRSGTTTRHSFSDNIQCGPILLSS